MLNKESDCVASMGEHITYQRCARERAASLATVSDSPSRTEKSVSIGPAGWFRNLGVSGTRSIDNVARNRRLLLANDHISRKPIMGGAGLKLMRETALLLRKEPPGKRERESFLLILDRPEEERCKGT